MKEKWFLFLFLLLCLFLVSCEKSKPASGGLSNEEKKILQELVRYDLAGSILKKPEELNLSFSSVKFDHVMKEEKIAEYYVYGKFQNKPFVWSVWKNQSPYNWHYASEECLKGCPDSNVFNSKDDLKTFMNLHWLKLEHNKLVDDCKCSHVAVKMPDLSVVEVTKHMKDFIEGVRNGKAVDVEEERRLVDDTVQLIQDTAESLQKELPDKSAYSYFLKDESRYLNELMLRYQEVQNTKGIESDEMAALTNELLADPKDEDGTYTSILSNIDYYKGPDSFDKEKSAFKELLVHVYRYFEFTRLHSMYFHTNREFLTDVEKEKEAIGNVYQENKELFQTYNLPESVYTFASAPKEDKTDVKAPVPTPTHVCGNGEPLFTRVLEGKNAFLYADNPVFTKVENPYAGAEVGNTVVEGSFYLCYNSTKTSVSVSSINLNRNQLVSRSKEILVCS